MRDNAGFSLIEVIIVVAVALVLGTIIVSGFVLFKKTSDLNNNVQEFMGALRFAQNKALSSENNSPYGVYINTDVLPNKYVLFAGSSYALRDIPADQIYFLLESMEFYDVNLGGDNEIVFNKLTGATEESGNISIRLKAETDQNKTIYISNSGAVGLSPFSSEGALDYSRIKDSRHVQFNYSRVIDTATENIVLIFDDVQTQTIPINSNLIGGEIDWKGTVSVGGSDQKLEINTIDLNVNTKFNIFRDRRYNNKGLKVKVSGDSSGHLAQYSADGTGTDSSSIYVSNFAWQ